MIKAEYQKVDVKDFSRFFLFCSLFHRISGNESLQPIFPFFCKFLNFHNCTTDVTPHTGLFHIETIPDVALDREYKWLERHFPCF